MRLYSPKKIVFFIELEITNGSLMLSPIFIAQNTKQIGKIKFRFRMPI